jgi:hypothetical protein
MTANNLLFWISLASGVAVLAAIAVFRFARGPAPAESPPAADLPDTD